MQPAAQFHGRTPYDVVAYVKVKCFFFESVDHSVSLAILVGKYLDNGSKRTFKFKSLHGMCDSERHH